MKKKEVIQRQGNLELLRIFCMVIIIVHHYCLWGGIISINTSDGNQMIANIGLIIGRFASNAFVLITGYFLFQSNFKIQKAMRLILEFVLYSVLVNIVMIIITKDSNMIEYMYLSIFPIFFEMHWFVVAFLGMYFMLPFVKKALKDISKKSYFIILVILGFVLAIIPSIIGFGYNIESNNAFGNVVFFLYLAMIGGYISKFNINILKKKRYNILLIVGIFLVFNSHYQYEGTNSMLSMIVAILIFDLFLKFKIKNNNIINFFSSASLGILLLHDNRLFNQTMWQNIFHTERFYYAKTYQLILHMLICAFGIYLVGAVIDYIRRTVLEKIIFTRLDKNKVLNQINDAFNE